MAVIPDGPSKVRSLKPLSLQVLNRAIIALYRVLSLAALQLIPLAHSLQDIIFVVSSRLRTSGAGSLTVVPTVMCVGNVLER